MSNRTTARPIRRARWVVVAAVAAAVAGAMILASSGAGTAAARGCKPRVTSFAGAPARVFCGPARATVRVGAKRFRFRNGRCEKTSNYVTVNLGTVVIGSPSRRRPKYFGLTVGRLPLGGGTRAANDGTYTSAVISFVHAGRSYAIATAAVTLAGARTRGSFTGRLTGTTKVSGSFHC